VRSWSCQLLVSFGLVLFGPIFGWDGSAQAGYLARFQIVQPCIPLFTDGASCSSLAELGAVVLGDVDDEPGPRRGEQSVSPSLAEILMAARGGSTRSTGAGSQQPPSGNSHYLATAARSQPEVANLVGFLFLQDGKRRPPPFPSRIFRPPRLGVGIASSASWGSWVAAISASSLFF
jgi:hypothetical protein